MSNSRKNGVRPLPLGRTLLAAILIECGVVLSAVSLMAIAAAKPEHDAQPMLMVVDTTEIPKEESKPLPKPVERIAPVKTAQHIAPVPVPDPPPAAPTPSDSPITEVPPPPPPPVRAVATGIDKEAEFAAKLKAAIQAAVSYPPAARSMGFRGKARVEFIFRDGGTQQVRVIQGSGIGMIDNAALAAVANAVYPPAPDTLKGKDMLYQVTVMFELNAAR
jgi:protein TonB